MQKALLVFSGGPDSTAAAIWGMENQFSTELLTFKFRSLEQDGELAAAVKVSEMLKLSQTNVDWTSPMAIFPHRMYPLMHAGTPKAHAEDKTGSLLPFGAGLILTFATAFALSRGIDNVIWGATKDDAYGNLDYDQGFSDDLSALISKSVGCKVTIHAPFAHKHKFQILDCYRVKRSLFAATWSCKAGGLQQCGKCKSCLARRLSTVLANFDDSTEYSTKELNVPFTQAELSNPLILGVKKLAQAFQSEKMPPHVST
ncbi:MAG: ExsB [Edaphobacter sp.]|nr:ExsB [Edaphobacter sp.]